MTGMDFGVFIAPTPRPPGDTYYDEISKKIIQQKWEWEEELGRELGVQKTVDWLNRHVEECPVPFEISEAIAEARVNTYNSTRMELYFRDGRTIILLGNEPWFLPYKKDISIQNKKPYNDFPAITMTNSTLPAETTKNAKVLILAPFGYEGYEGSIVPVVYEHLANELVLSGYDVKCVATKLKQILYLDYLDSDVGLPGLLDDIEFHYVINSDGKADIQVHCMIKNEVEGKNIVRPEDYQNIGEYGVIYISTHGLEDNIACCIYYEGDEKLEKWLAENEGKWKYAWVEWLWGDPYYYEDREENPKYYVKIVMLNEEFFLGQDFSGSIVFVDACHSGQFYENTHAFSDAKVYLGFDRSVEAGWTRDLSYSFFYYLMYNFEMPTFYGSVFGKKMKTLKAPETFPPPEPMSVRAAYNILKEIYANPDPFDYSEAPEVQSCQDAVLNLYTGPYDNTYFPVPAHIVVEEE